MSYTTYSDTERRKNHSYMSQAIDTIFLKGHHAGLDTIRLYDTLDSTNLEARRRRVDFAGQNALLICDTQTAGQGQYGRRWESETNLGLWMSLFLSRANVLKHDLSLLSLYVGIIIHGVISKLIQREITLKWPNDVMIGALKCGGVLTEIQWSGSVPASVILGIGINLSHRSDNFSKELQQTATSLLIQGWKTPDRQIFLDFFLHAFFDKLDLLDHADDLARLWNRHAFNLNQTVQWKRGNQITIGKFLGINSAGEAQILIDGSIHSFKSGAIGLTGNQNILP